LNQDAFFVEEIKTKRGDIVYAIGVFDGTQQGKKKACAPSLSIFAGPLRAWQTWREGS
jgi:hypothetical protein